MSTSNFLSSEMDPNILESMGEKKLLLDNLGAFYDLEEKLRLDRTLSDEEAWKILHPTPGCVIKTADSEGNKVFINLCKSPEIPEPDDLSDTELWALWHSDEVTNYRIPISVMDPHDELDKAGKKAVVYDVAINTKSFEKVTVNDIFRSFVIEVVLVAIENKYDVELRKEDYVILRNRNCIGHLTSHRIRNTGAYKYKKPLIEEIGDSPSKNNVKEDNLSIKQQIKQSYEKPKFRLLNGFNILLCQCHLPSVKSSREIRLDVGENRIIIETKDNDCLMDLFLPIKIDEYKTKANFNLNSKILTVIMRSH